MTDSWIRLRPVPKELGELIRQVNSIPSDREGIKGFSDLGISTASIQTWSNLKDACETVAEWLGSYPKKDYPEFTEVASTNEVRKICAAVSKIKNLPEPVPQKDKERFQKYRTTLKDFSEKCSYLKDAKSILRTVAADIGSVHRRSSPVDVARGGRVEDDALLRDLRRSTVVSSGTVLVPTELAVDPLGKIFEIPHPLIKMLRGVEASRIRLCLRVGCGKIFWAGREDSFACSKKCNDAAKQRLKRAKGRSEEEKEKQRIYQRERRARIKERKNRRNQIKVERENKQN